MAAARADAPRSLYECDETAWLEATAELVASRRFAEIDADLLSEYLSDMARRDSREVLSRLTILLVHLLKWEHHPGQRTGGWQAIIDHQRAKLADLLEAGTLRRYAYESLPKAHDRAHRQVALETGLGEGAFPAECPFSVDQLIGHA